MDLRFEDASEQAIQIMRECITEFFPELHQAKILILMDTKKRESQRAIVIGRLLKTNDLHRHLSVEESGHDDGYDYIMCLDKLAWSFMADEDKVRLIRHELRHTEVDGESEKNPYKIRCHTIEDFFSEVQLNEDDPHWVRRVGESLMAAYEAQKDPQQKLF